MKMSADLDHDRLMGFRVELAALARRVSASSASPLEMQGDGQDAQRNMPQVKTGLKSGGKVPAPPAPPLAISEAAGTCGI